MNLLKYETQLQKNGYTRICGIDEVGVGACAGPLIACAIILDLKRAKKIHFRQYKIYDSKQVPKEVRSILFKRILKSALAVGIGTVDVSEINHIKNIHKCGCLARNRALKDLAKSGNSHCHIYWHPKDRNIEYGKKLNITYVLIVPDYIFVDGPYGMSEVRDIPVKSIIGGDAKSISIGAASIVAKVLRDNHMLALNILYPQYGWNTGCGYITKWHKNALMKHGPSPYHRLYFKPVKESA